mgnify:CR=1 FL=1
MTKFEWSEEKNQINKAKHGVGFHLAQFAFADPQRVIAEDTTHSSCEKRFYCIGQVDDGLLTVRFTYRGNVIRIIGAGYWRKGKRLYEKQGLRRGFCGYGRKGHDERKAYRVFRRWPFFGPA